MSAVRRWAWRLVDMWAEKLAERMQKNDSAFAGGASCSIGDGFQSGTATCVLHVGFLSIPETADQISRLKNEPLECDFSPCRSRFMAHSAAHFVTPIDALAGRVTGTLSREDDYETL